MSNSHPPDSKPDSLPPPSGTPELPSSELTSEPNLPITDAVMRHSKAPPPPQPMPPAPPPPPQASDPYPQQAPYPLMPYGQLPSGSVPQMPTQMHPQMIQMQAPPPSHPYRIPTTPNEPPMPAFPGFPTSKPPRPVLGSAIAVYGVLLWSFVVAGELTTSWISGVPISQGSAVLIVFVSTFVAWLLALRRSKSALPSATMGRFIWRGIGIAALAFLFFLVTIIVATIFGQSTHGHDFLIAFFLVSAALSGIIMGPRLTQPKRPERTQGAKFAVISVWIVGVILTFVAGAELVTNG